MKVPLKFALGVRPSSYHYDWYLPTYLSTYLLLFELMCFWRETSSPEDDLIIEREDAKIEIPK